MRKLISIVLAMAIFVGVTGVTFAENSSPISVAAYFDGTLKGDVSVMHSGDNDYPMIALSDLATVIGGTLNGNTLKKDKVTLTFTEGSRIAGYTHADYPNRADYMTTYYTNTSEVFANESSNELSTIQTSPIPGEASITSLPVGYTNDGTDGDNDGYILEYAPFISGGKLYVPLYCLMPTLNYHTEYFRFDTTPNIKITTGTKEALTPYTVYAKDFGAVGDGKTDDREALLKGFYDAVMHEGPSKFVLEANKTYRASERLDAAALFLLYDRDDFVFEGNNSTIVLESPTNGGISMRSCKNIIVRNVTFVYEDHTGTHGIIESVDKTNKTFTMQVPKSVTMPVPTDWIAHYGKKYGFGQLYDIAGKHPKFVTPDHFYINSIEDLGNRRFKVSYTNNDTYMEAGDGFVMNNRSDGYDTDVEETCIRVFLSRDVEFDGVTISGSNEVGASVGICDGSITFRNYKMQTKAGTATASSADGIHYWRNRATLLIENSELWNNLDDHVNTKGAYGIITYVSDDLKTVYATGEGASTNLFKPGDELVFLMRTTVGVGATANGNTSVCRAYVKEIKTIPQTDTTYKGQTELVLDRAISETIKTNASADTSREVLPVLYNIMASGEGTCIRGTRFLGSRRHAYISRSRNTIFMNNYVQNNGGCTAEASDEIGTSEGPFPDAFTIRNNRTYGDGITESSSVQGVISVRAWRTNYTTAANNAIQREIDGALIQGNIIQVNTGRCSIFVNSVKDLYMSNNQILWNDSWTDTKYSYGYTSYKPVNLVNCEIKEFTNLTYEGPSVSKVVTETNCTGSVDANEIH